MTQLQISFLCATVLLGACSEDEIKVNTPPTIEDQKYMLIENAEAGTVVGKVTVTDQEEDEIIFSFEATDLDDSFQIDPYNGEIQVVSPERLDFESSPTFILMVTANDGKSVSQATITIDLIDVEEIVNHITLGDDIYESVGGHIVERPNAYDHSVQNFIVANDSISFPLIDKVYIAVRLISMDTTSLRPGVFEFSTQEAESELINTIGQFSLWIPEKGWYEGLSGTISVEPHFDLNYTIEGSLEVYRWQDQDGNLTEYQGKTELVTFSYTGDFSYSTR